MLINIIRMVKNKQDKFVFYILTLYVVVFFLPLSLVQPCVTGPSQQDSGASGVEGAGGGGEGAGPGQRLDPRHSRPTAQP